MALVLGLLPVVASAWSADSSAQAVTPKPLSQYARDYWTVMDGLPQLGTNAVAQDLDGYIWFGTLGGLSRFDGDSFRNYYTSNTPALRSQQITALLPDSKGRMWIGTTHGLTLHDNHGFSAARVQGEAALNQPTNVQALALDGNDRLLIGSRRGLYVHEDGKGTRLLNAIGPVTAIAASQGSIWAGGDGVVYQLDGETSTPYPLPGGKGDRLVSLTNVADQLWAATMNGLYRLEGRHWQALPDPRLQGERYRRGFKGEHDALWVIESSRLMRLENGQVVEDIMLDPEFPHAAEALVDRDGNLWLTSANVGVMRLWQGVAWHYPLKDAPASPLVWTTARLPDGSILSGGAQGLNVARDGLLQPYLHDAQLATVYTLMVEDELIWAGTTSGVVLYRNRQRVPMPALDPLQGTRITGLLRNPDDGNLWISADSGVYRLGRDNTLHALPLPAQVDEPIMRVLLRRHDGQLLVGGESGLYRIQGDQLQRLQMPVSDPAVLALHELPSGELLVGTRSQEGLSVFANDHWSNVDSRQGLPAHHVPYAIVNDDVGNVLVSGYQGVYRVKEGDLLEAARDRSVVIRSQMLLAQNNRIRPGQVATCCNGGGLGRALIDQGKLWVPTSDGLFRINTRIDTGAPIPPTAVIERVRAGDQWRTLDGNDWVLPAKARNLRIEFNVLGFNPMHMVRARYRLVGWDEHWSETDAASVRAVQYTNLPPGFYTFEVIGSWDGRPPESSSRQSFEIRPYFHETTAFKLLVVVGLLLLGALLAAGISRWKKHRRAALEKLVHDRTIALNDANRELDSISRTDELTGLYNRRHVTEQIPRDLAALPSGRQNAGDCTLFALIDIDHFKTVNDRHGHDSGDKVLVEVARRLSAQMRSGDYIARWGGEEFLAVLRGHTRGRHAAVADRLLECIRSEPFVIDGKPRPITISIGLAEVPVFANAPEVWNWEQSLWLADMAMYGAKRAGRNGWAIYQPVSPDIKPARDASPRLLIARNDLVLLHSERPQPEPDQGVV